MDHVPGANAECTGSTFSVWFPQHPSRTCLFSSSWKREKKTECLWVEGRGSVLPCLLGRRGPPARTRQAATFPSHWSSWGAQRYPAGSAWTGLLGTAGGVRVLPSLAATPSNDAVGLTLPGPAVPASAPPPGHG